jgi:biopolymer transport protein ExbD
VVWKRERRRRDTAVPTDSLSDIAFLLIIFFILTTSIQRLTGFQAEIPSAERAEQPQQAEKMPSIKLHGGNMTLNDQPVDANLLRAKLADLQLPSRPQSERVIVVEASGQVAYQQYFEVLSAISGAGGVVGVLSEEREARK